MRNMSLLEKIMLAVLAFGAIVFFYTILKIWSEGKLHYFLFVEDWGSALVVFGVVFVVGALFKFFWKWEIRSLFGGKRAGRRR